MSEEMSPGRRGYNAFGDYVRWTDALGMRMPRWDALPESQRNAWEKQAEVIIAADRRRKRSSELKVHGVSLPGDKRTLCGLVAAGLKLAEKDQVTCGSCRIALKERTVNASAGRGIS